MAESEASQAAGDLRPSPITVTRQTKPAGPSRWVLLVRTLFVIASIVALYFLAAINLEWRQQAIFGAILLCFAIVMNRVSNAQQVTLLICVLSMFSTVRYAHYRFSSTYTYLSFNWTQARLVDLVFVFILLSAETYEFIILFLGFFQTARPLNRRPEPLPTDTDSWPDVDLYIPTYNEPLDVVRSTVLAALNIDWPSDRLHVYVLDDGRRAEFRDFAEACGAGYIIRPDNKHAKAGNINHALKKTTGEFVAIFDCDHVPTRSFLQMTMGWFLKDPQLGMLQTPHHFYSPDPFERNLGIFRQIPNEGALFYGVIQNGSDLWNATFFCGSCAVLRRTALEEIGGVAVETVTEDAHTSLRMQRRGWNTAYIRYPQAGGLATGSLAAHIGQRIRWARGMVQILRLDNPLLGRGLKLTQRLCYLNSMMHFLYAVPRLVFLTSPLVYLLFGFSNIYGYGPTILAYAITHLGFAMLANSRVQGQYRFSFWNEVYETVLAPYILLPTLVALISPRHGKFNVTSKGDIVGAYFDWRLAWPYLVLLIPNMIGVAIGLLQMVGDPPNRGTLLINVLWSMLNVIILGAATAVARESTQRRASVRISATMPVVLETSEGRRFETQTIDISRGGVSVRPPFDFTPVFAERVTAIFPTGEEDYRFPMRLVDIERNRARFNFTSLELEQEERLVRVIFGRADSWMNWRTNRNQDRPLLSFLFITGVALQGISAIPLALVDLMRRQPRAVPEVEKSAARNAALPGIAIAFLAMSLGLVTARPLKAAESPSSSNFSDSYDLFSLGQRQPIVLRGAEARTNLSFPVPITKVVTHATLLLNYRMSAAVAPRVSVINLSMNGASVGSVPVLQSSEPEQLISAQVDLPADILARDNTLTLELQARCAPGCNGGTIDDLWLRVEPSTHLQLSGVLLPLANDLRLLPMPFFDQTSTRTAVVPVALPQEPDAPTLEAAGVIASWIGILADYRGFHFPVTLGVIPAGNAIVLALHGSDLLSGLALDGLAGPSVALRTNPSDPNGKLLLIMGDDSAQLLSAARAVSLGRYPRRGDSAALAGFQLPPPRQPYDAPRWLSTRRSVGLGQSRNAGDLRVYGDGAVNLYFRLPPDLYFGSTSYIPLRLAFRMANWPAGEKAIVRIRLNGVFIAARKLSAGTGEETQTELIGLPVSALTPNNTVTVEFARNRPFVARQATYPEEVVLPESSVDLSGFRHFVEMPRLDLFANAGFPFTRRADLAGTAVVLPRDPSPQQFSFYLALLGFFGARTGYPALQVNVWRPDEIGSATDRDLVIVSANAAAEAFASHRPSQAVAQLENGRVVFNPPKGYWLDRFAFLRGPSRNDDLLNEVLSADPAPDGFVEELASPLYSGRTAVVLGIPGPKEGLNAFETALAGGAGIEQIQGSLSLLQGNRFHSFDFNSRAYTLGDLPWYAYLRFWLARHYLLIPVILLALAFLLSTRIGVWLEERARFRVECRVEP